ncbi:peptidoglycan DD-metalloendopeptidase family protein [Dactylosporangium sp. AC04546]|uniref:peptidoglycan DD-metalloendopeptidase family protein n=1 Tax=Dactylosporangium sp. AC04546 TaxID=2862460 RepID=UPI001EE10576|nr:peptidoglycan DD-metalloendopeptidase family protein [Dactylosporangium sp. AC04546]WVK85438.1 peptidoglycan DD-metalloendopeptidase family protein [Dactylosporangium sp. AC04546]
MRRTALFLAVLIGGLLPAMDAQAAQATQTAIVVSPKRPLNVRAGSAVWTPQLRTLAHGSSVTIVCQVRGQRIDQGTVRVTDQWDRLGDGTYVSDAWIQRSQEVPPCETATAAAAAAAPASIAGTVASGGTALKARTAPAHGATLVGAFPNGSTLTLACQVRGETIAGSVRTTPMWNRLPSGTYVSDAYVRRGATPPPCAAAAPAPPAAPPAAPAAGAGRWVSPLPGFTARPGFRTPNNPKHIGVDIMSFTGTPIRAASAGTVVEVVCNIEAGHSCDKPGSASVGGCGWYVKLQHAGGVATLYCHMVRRAIVQPGQKVAAGQVIGYVGSSGNSSAPHLHFEVHLNAPPTGPYNAVDPLPFMRAHGAPIG